jgi:gas vesicle protein
MAQQRNTEITSYISGLILGLLVSAPIAAWLSPHSGQETRQEIRQQGFIIRRKVGQTVRKPIEAVQEGAEQIGAQVGQIPAKVGRQVDQIQDKVGQQIDQIQDKVGQIKGESVEDALAEGKAIAAQRAARPS